MNYVISVVIACLLSGMRDNVMKTTTVWCIS